MDLHHDDNVVLFPKWRKTLENESLSALKDKKYEEALSKLDQLVKYHIVDHEIMTGKLICLIELGRLNEAQNLCEELLKEDDKNYYHYVHIYLTILFQTNQYDLLMQQVEYEIQKKDIPKIQKDQFMQLYEISEKMNLDVSVEKEKVIFQQLFQAVEENDFVEQWRQAERLRTLGNPPSQEVINLLKNDSVHPLAKTAIILWLKNNRWSENVEIRKFDITLSIRPNELEEIEKSEMIYETLLFLNDLEQDNPSLYHLVYELLYNYTYVLFPITPPKEDYVYIAKALETIGRESLGIQLVDQGDNKQRINQYIDEIKLCESLYLSIIEG